MKTYFFGLILLIFSGFLLEVKAQTFQKSLVHSTIKWNEDITINNNFLLQDAILENAKKITIAGAKIESNNVSINCNEMEINSIENSLNNITIKCNKATISSSSISLNNVTIICDEITFTTSVGKIKLSNSVKIVCRNITFDGRSTLPINNTGSGEFLITYTGDFTKSRNLEFIEFENFQVNFIKR